MTNVGRGRGGRGEGWGNTNDPNALLSHGAVWSDPLNCPFIEHIQYYSPLMLCYGIIILTFVFFLIHWQYIDVGLNVWQKNI